MRQNPPYILWSKEYEIKDQSDPNSCFVRLRRLGAMPFARPQKNHFHPEIEIALFLEGYGTYVVNRKTYPIEPGDIFLCGSMVQHCFSDITGPEGIVFLTLHFEPRFIWSRGSNLFDAKYLRIFEELDGTMEYRLPRCANTDQASELLMHMEQEFIGQEADYEAMVKVLLLRMLVLFNRMLPPAVYRRQNIPSVTNLEQVEAVMTYIQTHLSDQLRLEQLADIAHLSPCYFSAIFKRLNGMSPWNYITAKRIELAQNLLSSSSMSMTDVAQACGYNNAANFNRAFRQICNMAPSAWSKSVRQG